MLIGVQQVRPQPLETSVIRPDRQDDIAVFAPRGSDRSMNKVPASNEPFRLLAKERDALEGQLLKPADALEPNLRWRYEYRPIQIVAIGKRQRQLVVSAGDKVKPITLVYAATRNILVS